MIQLAATALVLAVTIPPAPLDRISDGARLLDPAAHAQVASLISTTEAQQGIKLGVLTFSDLDDDPKTVAVRTINYWQLSPRSILLLISKNPRKIYLQPGNAFAGLLTFETSTAIARAVIAPALRSGQNERAIEEGLSLGVRQAVSAPMPVDRVATPPGLTDPGPGPGPEPGLMAARHPFTFGEMTLLFLFSSIVIGSVIYIIRKVIVDHRREREDGRAAARQTWTMPQVAPPAPSAPTPAWMPTPPRAGTGVIPAPQVVAVPQTTVIMAPTQQSSLVEGMMLNELMHDHRPDYHHHHSDPTEVDTVYAPAPRHHTPAPPPRRDTPVDDSSSSSTGDGGGGIDWGSSDSGGSDSGGGGGGGSDW